MVKKVCYVEILFRYDVKKLFGMEIFEIGLHYLIPTFACLRSSYVPAVRFLNKVR